MGFRLADNLEGECQFLDFKTEIDEISEPNWWQKLEKDTIR